MHHHPCLLPATGLSETVPSTSSVLHRPPAAPSRPTRRLCRPEPAGTAPDSPAGSATDHGGIPQREIGNNPPRKHSGYYRRNGHPTGTAASDHLQGIKIAPYQSVRRYMTSVKDGFSLSSSRPDSAVFLFRPLHSGGIAALIIYATRLSSNAWRGLPELHRHCTLCRMDAVPV